MENESIAERVSKATKKVSKANNTLNSLSIPSSKKSGIFTKKYKGNTKYKALKERVDFWTKKHGGKRTLQIMLEQGIITKKQYKKSMA